MSVCNSKGPVKANQPVSSCLLSPSLPHIQQSGVWAGWVFQGEEDKASWLPQPASHSAARKARLQIQSRRQASVCLNPSFPSEFDQPHAPLHSNNWHQASDSPTHRPAHPFPWKQLKRHERGPERRDTGANTQLVQHRPTEQKHINLWFLRLQTAWFSLACPWKSSPYSNDVSSAKKDGWSQLKNRWWSRLLEG